LQFKDAQVGGKGELREGDGKVQIAERSQLTWHPNSFPERVRNINEKAKTEGGKGKKRTKRSRGKTPCLDPAGR